VPITRSLMIDRRGFLVGVAASAAAGALPACGAEPLNYVRVRGPIFRQAVAHAVDLDPTGLPAEPVVAGDPGGLEHHHGGDEPTHRRPAGASRGNVAGRGWLAAHAAVPSIEMVRMVSSGTEATMSALRLARGFTGRDLVVLSCCMLREQTSLVDAARDAVASGAADRALTFLRQYQDKFPGGVFRPEAAALKIEALARLGRGAEVHALANRFVAEYGDGPLTDRVRRAAGSTSR